MGLQDCGTANIDDDNSSVIAVLLLQ